SGLFTGLFETSQLRKARRPAREWQVLWSSALPAGFQCLLITACRIKRDRWIIPIPIWVKWIEPHRLADQFDAFLSAAGDSKRMAQLRDTICVVGVERNASFEMRERRAQLG